MRPSRIVVDKCTSAASRWRALVARILLPAGLFAMSVFGAVPNTAHAQTIDPATKLAPDLVSALNAPNPPKVAWLVDSISPNRLAAKAASLLEMTSGTSNVRTTMLGVRTGYDGTGVGIAILDSGIYYKHGAFAADGAGNRVRTIVSMNNMSDGEAMGVGKWTAGVDTSATYAPGSLTETTYESRINNSSNTDPDDYGHGTHVASIAAGRSVAGAPNYARRSIVLGSR